MLDVPDQLKSAEVLERSPGQPVPPEERKIEQFGPILHQEGVQAKREVFAAELELAFLVVDLEAVVDGRHEGVMSADVDDQRVLLAEQVRRQTRRRFDEQSPAFELFEEQLEHRLSEAAGYLPSPAKPTICFSRGSRPEISSSDSGRT